MEFIDFLKRTRTGKLDAIFPAWRKNEGVAFYAPHDDDVALGAGYLLQAVIRNGGRPIVVVFCLGDAGYSTPKAKKTIVSVRRRQAGRAYARLGVPEEKIFFLGALDFTLMSTVSRGQGSRPDLFDGLVALLRRERISRIVTASPRLENWDHTAAFYHAVYTSAQSGDPVLADLGPLSPIRTILAYSVWADFEPAADRGDLRADKGILASAADEKDVREALGAFKSQAAIMDRTVAIHRQKRRAERGYLELFQTVEIRRPIDYSGYMSRLKNCRKDKA
jgi:LmbE family N-acetylglucosaminyl deacetylase